MDFQTELDKIMDNFNFHKVQEVMDAIDWKWHSVNGVPTLTDLRKQARQLLTNAYEMGRGSGKEFTVSTGGFSATFDPRESYLGLSFIVSDWNNHYG